LKANAFEVVSTWYLLFSMGWKWKYCTMVAI